MQELLGIATLYSIIELNPLITTFLLLSQWISMELHRFAYERLLFYDIEY